MVVEVVVVVPNDTTASANSSLLKCPVDRQSFILKLSFSRRPLYRPSSRMEHRNDPSLWVWKVTWWGEEGAG